MPTVKELRESKGLSQMELAYKAGVSYGTISRLESGEPVNRSTINAICLALDVKPDQVTGVNISNRVRSRGQKHGQEKQ